MITRSENFVAILRYGLHVVQGQDIVILIRSIHGAARTLRWVSENQIYDSGKFLRSSFLVNLY